MPEHVPLETFLLGRLFGQETAIREFSSAIESAEQGPRRPGRTRAFLLLLGPTGTGKTEMVKLCASWLYGAGARSRLERFDMGEYQHRDSILRFLGGAGQPALFGAAVDRLRVQGGGILLLDEIEKAHPDLLTSLLSFDDARSTMSDGSTKDLSSCFVIMTSNLGAAEASQMASSGGSAVRRKVLREAEQALRKETLARFTAAIVMDLLSFETQERIARSLLESELQVQSAHWRRRIVVPDTRILGWLVGRGFSPDMGARNIRRTIERHLGDALRQCAASAPAGPGLPPASDLASGAAVLSISGDLLEAHSHSRSETLTALLLKDPDSRQGPSAKAQEVELLDFRPLFPWAALHYVSLEAERRSWTSERRARLCLRTGCLWALYRSAGGAAFVLGENGEGEPRALSESFSPRVSLYAELRSSDAEPGYFETRPFCSVALDERALGWLGRRGSLPLDEFLSPLGPESEGSCGRWHEVLSANT
jgi:DNA polymerase III delta prime subunit